MIVVDTSALIDALCQPRRSLDKLESLISNGEVLIVPALVLYEWFRGPRTLEELDAQERLLPADHAVPFGPAEAARAAELYRTVRRARGREADLAIAATAITREASLWTLNRGDFEDVPGLSLV